jgi:hypothetical protein
VIALLVLPWVEPFAPGPSSSAVPLLVAWSCALVLLLVTRVWPRWVLPGVLCAAVLGLVAQAAGLQIEVLGAWAALLAMTSGALAVHGIHDSKHAAGAVAWSWAIAALASSVMALAQYFGAAEALTPWVHSASLGESYANLRQRNQFATLTSLGLVALWWLHAQGRLGFGWAAVAGVLLAAGNAASASRIGLLQWLTLLPIAWLWAGGLRSRRWLPVWCMLAYGVAAACLPRLLEAFTGAGSINVFSRIAAPAHCGARSVLLPNVLELIAARPLGGWGWGKLDEAHYMHLYSGERFCDILDNAHSLPLHIAVELGLPLALLMCGAAVRLVWRARPWREAIPHRRLAWLGVWAIALHSMVEYPLWYGPFQLALACCIGLLLPGGRSQEADAARARQWPQRLAVGTLGALALAAVFWDYARMSQLYLPPQERWGAYRDDPAGRIGRAWFFQGQIDFARLTTTDISAANAAQMLALARKTLSFSPEPRVVEKLLDSALVLGREDLLVEHVPRFRAAFPEEAQAWMKTRGAGAQN